MYFSNRCVPFRIKDEGQVQKHDESHLGRCCLNYNAVSFGYCMAYKDSYIRNLVTKLWHCFRASSGWVQQNLKTWNRVLQELLPKLSNTD